ncbi:hypothetical protein NCER_100341 [Vairimorpha ceranae BRL01]|uniref:Uncharacterized protein n=2 Tax=Vairimorpha ceranae TaxID=40302 RepID=C4V7B7_VAIC1|nr:hypothetical protein AAJ76_600090387 [Vairimorpha ceranae]EEQ82892.1 hypothetical protein NCER_100341 [Vairimorpha ceranae BRL01]KKO76171.1 hypothetical protein AAJ76_600090387 [Vairimorpha ceranae]
MFLVFCKPFCMIFYFLLLANTFNTIYKKQTDDILSVEVAFYSFNYEITKLFSVKIVNDFPVKQEDVTLFTVNYYKCDSSKNILEEYKYPNNQTVTVLRFNLSTKSDLHILGILDDNILFTLKDTGCMFNDSFVNLTETKQCLVPQNINLDVTTITCNEVILYISVGIPISVFLILFFRYLYKK